jgi:aldose 1-epimerase
MTKHTWSIAVCVIASLALVSGCATYESAGTGSSKMRVVKTIFGTVPGEGQADLYTITNANGMQADITNYGGIVTALRVPDADGRFDDVVLGYPDFDGYLDNSPHFGSLIGRFGNRIAMGKFTLDGQEYTLAVNNGPNHLHGGLKGFDKVLWEATPVGRKDAVGLKLVYVSPDGEEGYPGQLTTTVHYWLTNANELEIVYEAITTRPTPVNLTHHS